MSLRVNGLVLPVVMTQCALMKFADEARRRMHGHTVIQQLFELRLQDALEMPRNATDGHHNTCKPSTIFKNAQVRL